MSKRLIGQPTQQVWAQFRFSIIGSLLAAPPGPGELDGKIKQLASQDWVHPVNAQKVRFGSSTIEMRVFTIFDGSIFTVFDGAAAA
jgi:hypothetical protein